ncbi:MAG: hypothetical protein KGH72_00335 [Candidatus Micrarchaeota archaeon]|nr:hypothetical protein [Candidatus Micrarchaeota archaeon]
MQSALEQNRILLGIAISQWWASVGAAMFTIGVILIALAYATIRIIPSLQSYYTGIFPTVSFEAYTIGIIIVTIGLVLMLYSRYSLARLNLANSRAFRSAYRQTGPLNLESERS